MKLIKSLEGKIGQIAEQQAERGEGGEEEGEEGEEEGDEEEQKVQAKGKGKKPAAVYKARSKPPHTILETQRPFPAFFETIKQVVREQEIEMSQSKYHAHPAELPLATEFATSIKSSSDITLDHLIRLHYLSKNVVRHLSVVDSQWKDTVTDVFELEKDIANNEASKTQSTAAASLSWWLKTGKMKTVRITAIAGIVLSILLIFCEITIPSSTNVSPLGFIARASTISFLTEQIFTAVPLLYLSVCTYYPLFTARFAMYYAGRKRTDENTLLLNATLLLRVSTPLAYNFVLLLKMDAVALQNLIGPSGCDSLLIC